ncbi:MAG TPA: AbrB/MazE/SpoVT family DNA-binding domain-containing protein [Thermoanaerobaculia bacterium]|nr:AbrB/MazE/SpoVT family DNA-binding domain-containing protein [Thermoanaerobaculia bacterium]
MRTRIVRRGGELVVVIPEDVAMCEHFREDAEVDVLTVPEDEPTLEEMLARVTEENQHEYVDWGPPVGNEW